MTHMTATIIMLAVGVAVAIGGAWISAHCRHDMTAQHKRRRSDQ